MGISLEIIGNHTLPFEGRELQDVEAVLNKLNALNLQYSSFLKESVMQCFAPEDGGSDSDKANDRKRLEYALKKRSWTVHEFIEEFAHTESLEYYFMAPFDLDLYITKHFLDFIIPVNRYYQWFIKHDDESFAWREKWRMYIYLVSQALGGSYVMYFPDQSFDLCRYSPTEYDFPVGINKKFKCNIKNLSEWAEYVDHHYGMAISLSEADEDYPKRGNSPFVIDYFDDLDKSIQIF